MTTRTSLVCHLCISHTMTSSVLFDVLLLLTTLHSLVHRTSNSGSTTGSKECCDGLVRASESNPIDWRAVYTQLHKIQHDIQEGVCEEVRNLYQRREETGVKKVTMRPELPSAPRKGKKLLRKQAQEVSRNRETVTNKKLIQDTELQTGSNTPLLPLIECETLVTSHHRLSSKSSPTPLLPPVSSMTERLHALHARVYRGDLYWRVFDFIQLRYSNDSDPRSYTCLALAGCIPNTHVSNQDTTLPSPLFPV